MWCHKLFRGPLSSFSMTSLLNNPLCTYHILFESAKNLVVPDSSSICRLLFHLLHLELSMRIPGLTRKSLMRQDVTWHRWTAPTWWQIYQSTFYTRVFFGTKNYKAVFWVWNFLALHFSPKHSYKRLKRVFVDPKPLILPTVKLVK